jgi:hypothetical protein
MNLAEELALVAIDPSSGRHALGVRSELNACLAGLLVADLLLDGVVEIVGDNADRIAVTGKAEPKSKLLAAATAVVIERGPKIKSILSHMDRGLAHRLGMGTWDAIVSGLADAGVLGPRRGIRSHNDVLQPFVRDATVAALRVAAASDSALDPRVAALLSMSGPAHLLEVVAPERSARRHTRDRIDSALDATPLEPVGKIVRRLISDAASSAAGGVAASVAATG